MPQCLLSYSGTTTKLHCSSLSLFFCAARTNSCSPALMWRPPSVPHLLTWPSPNLHSTAFHPDNCKIIPDSSAVAVIININVICVILTADKNFHLTYRSDSFTYMCNPWTQPIYKTFTLGLLATYTGIRTFRLFTVSPLYTTFHTFSTLL